MVLPSHLQNNLTPTEIKFLAENELITILPRYSMKKVDLIGVCIGKSLDTCEFNKQVHSKTNETPEEKQRKIEESEKV